MSTTRAPHPAPVDAELAQAEHAIERLLLAFEAGSLPEAHCGERVRTLVGSVGPSGFEPLTSRV